MSAALQATPLGVLDILALTLWGEAGTRPVRGMEAVAAVVMTRVRLAALPDGPTHFGRGVAGVCRAPFQFPCWNPNHPRHAALGEAADDADPGYAAARRIAARALAGALADPTRGATHYHAEEALPRWALGLVPTAALGGLVFYRLAG
jgi:spore germination cell wall hydrolase CwlJ-like protein